jgi:hypothetical protein
MAAITTAEIEYTQQEARMSGPGRVHRKFAIVFPQGANQATNNTYPTGGVPLEKAKLGCPRNVTSLNVLGGAPTAGALNPLWLWNGNPTTPTLLAYETNTAGAPAAELDAATAFSADVTLVVDVEGW